MYTQIRKPPEWFELENYSDAVNLSAHGWLVQLIRRKWIIESPDTKLSRQDREVIRSVGILGSDRELDFGNQNYTNQMVRLTDCGTVYWLYNDLDDDVVAAIENSNTGNFSDETCSTLSIPIEEYILENRGLDVENNFTLTVDLSAPDHTIINQFAELLPEIRARYKIHNAEKFSESRSRRWAEAQVLPYLDLVDWMQETGIQVPNHVLGEWLFPNADFDVAEKIRKVTKRYAQKLTSWDFIQSLDSQS